MCGGGEEICRNDFLFHDMHVNSLDFPRMCLDQAFGYRKGKGNEKVDDLRIVSC